MYAYQQNELDAKTQYKILSGSIVPRPIAWITTENKTQTVLNLAPFSLFSIVAKEHPLVSVSILRQKGKQKDTALNLSERGEGVIHLVDQSLLEPMNQSSATVGREISEVRLNDLVTVPSEVVSVPALATAKARYEVKVYQHLPIKGPTGETIISDLFILEVVAFHLDEKIYDPVSGYVDVKAFNPLARLAGPEYGVIGETFELARPT